MAKTSLKKMEEHKIRVLEALQKDSGQSIDELAKNLGFSRQKIWRYMKRMEKDKTIWGYTAIISLKLQKLRHFTVLMKGAAPNIETLGIGDKDIVIESMYYVNGHGFDWQLEFTAPDITRAKSFCRSVKEDSNDFMLVETLFTARKHHIKNPTLKKQTISAKELEGLI